MNYISSTKKPFGRFDFIVYAVLIILTTVLFLTAFKLNDKASNGFEVIVDGQVCLTYRFDNGAYEIIENAEAKVSVKEEGFLITSEHGYNEIIVDVVNKEVKVVDTDCGISKECTYMSLKSGAIICIPHKLSIRALGQDDPIKIG